MKQVVVTTVLVALLLSVTFTVTSAGLGMEDPALCVAGKWLVVNSAAQSAVKVYVPRGTSYGDAADCGDPPSGVTALYPGHVVKTKAGTNQMTVEINAKHASDPITVSYGTDQSYNDMKNLGKGRLYFTFNLP